MPGQPTFSTAATYSSSPVPGVGRSASAAGGPGHMAFIVWVALIGVVLPVVILGGLKMGGFSFVFKGR